MTVSERDSGRMNASATAIQSPNAAGQIAAILNSALGIELPIRVRCWDGSEAGPPASKAAILIRDPRALKRLVWAPNELGLARAYVSGDLSFEGDIFEILDLPELIHRISRHEGIQLGTRDRFAAARTAAKLGGLGLPPAPPPEEVRKTRGPIHVKSRDAAAISHHYDVSNEFYQHILGPSMVYSCAYWASPPSEQYTLQDAQYDKLDLVCRKLGLKPGMRLLDVGCGWGSMAIHAAANFGVDVVGITISKEQAALARERVRAADLSSQVEIRIQDYRDINDGPFDAISSIGMSEHVGLVRLTEYARILMNQLRPGGRLLNHAIASVRSIQPRSKPTPSFITSYIFPDGEIFPLSATLNAMEQVGLEVRDSEALREHYELTLRTWVDNLREHWDEAVTLAGEARARTWLLYLAACALAFDHGNITVHQVLAVRQTPMGKSGMPATRDQWLARNL